MKSSPIFKTYQRHAYLRGVTLLVEAHDALGAVKTNNWTQAVILNDVFQKLERAAESLVDIAPNEFSSEVRQTVKRWTDGREPLR